MTPVAPARLAAWGDNRPIIAIAFVAYAVPNLILAAMMVRWNVVLSGGPGDWLLWHRALERFPDPARLFGITAEYAYIYSPAFVPLLAAIVPLGFMALAIAHAASLALLRDWRLILAVAVSWPFWTDLAFGNFFVFSFVAGFAAMRGSRWIAVAYLVLFLLMPRPIEAPVALWLLWRIPSTRWPFAWLFVAHAAFVLLGGFAGPWLHALLDLSGGNGQYFWNVGPTRLLGNFWLAFGVPIGIYLTYKGRPGLAGLAISPYVVPQYLLFGLLRHDQPVGGHRG